MSTLVKVVTILGVAVAIYFGGHAIGYNQGGHDVGKLKEEVANLKKAASEHTCPDYKPFTVTALIGSPASVKERFTVALREVRRDSCEWSVRASFTAQGSQPLDSGNLAIGEKVAYAGYEIELLKASREGGGLAQFGLTEKK